MSNPYGGGYEPYAPPPAPYGAVSRPTDALSIAAFVCALTCCAAPVGVGLGIAGLVRTRDGRRGGRWAAISGLVIGALVTLAMVAFVVFAAVMGSRTVWEDQARVGQCVDYSEVFGDLLKADCDEPHDAEVIWVGQLDERSADDFATLSTWAFCTSRHLEADYQHALVAGDYVIGYTTDAFDDDDPGEGDWVVCFARQASGEELEGSIVDQHDTAGA